MIRRRHSAPNELFQKNFKKLGQSESEIENQMKRESKSLDYSFAPHKAFLIRKVVEAVMELVVALHEQRSRGSGV